LEKAGGERCSLWVDSTDIGVVDFDITLSH
jgi:hypothetical protein